MRGETVAEGGSPHACPVGVSKIRARRRVESLLNRPLAEILSSTAPAVVFAKEDSRRRKPHRSMSRHARVVEATPGPDAVSSASARPQPPARRALLPGETLCSQTRDRRNMRLLASRPRLAATVRATVRACIHLPYISRYTSGGAPGAFSTCLVARNGLARSASGTVFLRHMGHGIAGQRVGHLDTKGGARVRAESQLAVWLMGWPRRVGPQP